MGSTRKVKAGGGKRFVLFSGLVAAGAGLYALLRRNQSDADPWATPDGSISAYTPPTSGRASTVATEESAPVEQAPSDNAVSTIVTQDAGPAQPETAESDSVETSAHEVAVADSEGAGSEAAESEVSESEVSESEVAESETAESHADLPEGAVRATNGQAPEGYPIKGNLKTGLFHEPGGKWFDDDRADLWFVDEAAAEKAGLTKAGTAKKSPTNSDELWADAKGWADGDPA